MKVDVRVHSVPKGSRTYSNTKSEDAFCHSDVHELPFAVAIADGHGDQDENASTCLLSAMVARLLCDKLVLSPEVLCDVIQECVHDKFFKQKNGAVATRVLFDSHGFQVMYVGDVRLYRFTPCEENAFEQLTEDHHPSHPGEFVRLTPLLYHPDKNPKGKFGLFPIGSEAPQRLMGGTDKLHSIMVTRSFGDPDMRPAIVSEPDVKTIALASNARHIFALCSDGGTDVVETVFKSVCVQPEVSIDDLLGLVRLHTSPEPDDDTTIMLIELASD